MVVMVLFCSMLKCVVLRYEGFLLMSVMLVLCRVVMMVIDCGVSIC